MHPPPRFCINRQNIMYIDEREPHKPSRACMPKRPLETAIASRLRGNAVRSPIRTGRRRIGNRALREHETRAEDGCVVLLLLLRRLAGLALLVVLLEHLDRCRLLGEEIDHVRLETSQRWPPWGGLEVKTYHGEVVETVAP